MPLVSRTDKLRFRRNLRRKQREANTLLQDAGEGFENHFIERLENLVEARRFALGWVLLSLLIVITTVLQTLNLSSLYQVVTPTKGGVYTEGIVGTYSGANPIFATGAVDSGISRLVFSSLLTYDADNKLAGDIASEYNVDDSGKVYTINLKKNVYFHDGVKLTADDVVYTFSLIQNPLVKSPYLTSWQGITIEKINEYSVRFSLKNALASFPHSLTMGILPEHIVKNIEPAKLRANAFNTTKPIGAGPFMWDGLQLSSATTVGSSTGIISLVVNPKYHRNGPLLEGYNLHTYENQDQMLAAYKKKLINTMAGLKEVPQEVADDRNSVVHKFRTTAAVMLFLRNDGVLADSKVRSALNSAIDKDVLYKQLGSDVLPVRSPILQGQVGYNRDLIQTQYDQAKAVQTLDAAGWKQASVSAIRQKDGKPLSFRVYAENTPTNTYILKTVSKQWRLIGVDMKPVLQSSSDFQVSLQIHSYDALLHGISIGADPDVYAYWHSSQADARLQNRLNFSEYKSTRADAALESGRTRDSESLRSVKYKPFLEAWLADTPAISLYEPKIIYVTRGEVYNLNDSRRLNTDVDRYNNVNDWAILQRRTTQ